jgi:hypothetical protein
MKRIWHRALVFYAIIGIFALSIFPLGFVHACFAAISSGPEFPRHLWMPFLFSMGLIVAIYAVLIFPFFKATYYLVKHYQADVNLDLETTRVVISKYLMANGIEYSTIEDRRLMPAYRELKEGNVEIALKFDIEDQSLYVEMMGTGSTTMWLGPIPDPSDWRFKAILDGTSEEISQAIEQKAAKGASGS